MQKLLYTPIQIVDFGGFTTVGLSIVVPFLSCHHQVAVDLTMMRCVRSFFVRTGNGLVFSVLQADIVRLIDWSGVVSLLAAQANKPGVESQWLFHSFFTFNGCATRVRVYD
jgi:hypothetical protein